MSYQLTIDELPAYLHARATGPNTPENMLGILVEVHGACLKLGRDAVLLEVCMSGPSLDPASIFRVISQRSPDGRTLRKIAYLDTSNGDPERMRFAETVAVNRGVNVRLFRELEAARQWMSDPGRAK